MLSKLVSIITPCYNASLYIKDTIESVLNQTYENWELLVIDDCSTDNSAEIIKSYRDKRIRYYKTEKPSGSPALPRNIGIANSFGQYIAFLDSDDIWYPTKLESQLKYMCENNVDFVYSYYRRFTSLDSPGGVIKSPDYANLSSLKWRDYIPMLTIMLDKKIISEVQFDNKPKEDYIFLLKLFKKGIVAYNTKETVALYRISPNSRSSNKLDMLKKHYALLKNEGFTSLESVIYTFTHCFSAVIKYNR